MGAFVSICFGALAGFISPLFGLQWRLALFSAIGAAVNVGMNVVLIPSYGAYGSAWATLATELLTMTLMMATTLRALRLRPRLGRMARTVVAAAVMAGVMLLLRPLGLAPALVGGGLTYAIALPAFGIVSLDELRALRAERRTAAAAQPPSATER
jgi:O-antigen/teichoic acid export membrane protein